uniref:Uncharacterized protein n=1 Tax=candidate division WOR-3 bacterium TaxID=2052148 RepID=A0A7C4XAN7_UNCW3
MRIIIIVFLILGYLFGLVYIESELVKTEIRKEVLKKTITELKNEKENLHSQLLSLSHLALIESEAKKKDFVFPQKNDILGIVK